jgi:ribosomal protein L7/L12
MRWKVVVGSNKPSRETIRVIAELTSLLHDEILQSLGNGNLTARNNLTESEAQKLADQLGKDPDVICRVLPDMEPSSTSSPSFRVLLVDFRPGYRTRLRRRLQKLTGLSNEQIVIWLSRMPFVLGSGVDGDAARQIRKHVIEAGGIVRIEPESATRDRIPVRTRSTAVFQPPAAHHDILIPSSEETHEQAEQSVSEQESPVPPFAVLPEGFTTGPPPLDEIDTAFGRVMRNPPLKFLPGQPSPSLKNGFFKSMPPVLKESGESVPSTIIFDSPASLFEEKPDIIGRKDESDPSKDNTPSVVIPFPPVSSISEDMLLPPFISDSSTENVVHSVHEPPPFIVSMEKEPYGIQLLVQAEKASLSSTSTDPDLLSSKKPFIRPEVDSDSSLKLFLYSPFQSGENDVANALSEVLGFSIDRSRKMLEQSPSCLAEFWNNQKAVEIAHKLEKRGVTISLMHRELIDRSTSSGKSRSGFRAWLTENG